MGRWQLALALALAPALLGATPGRAGVDLVTLLAQPPSSDWVESVPSNDVLVGPFTAQSYGEYVSRSLNTPSAAQSHLERYGFVGGYAREWEQRVTRDYLIERVFQFSDESGASSWYSGLRTENETASYYLHDISEPAGIPNSFGVVDSWSSGSGHEFRVEFYKGNLMFIVHAGSDTNDLSAMVIRQAQTEYRTAPTSLTSNVSAGTRTVPSNALLVVGAVVIAGVLLVSAFVLILVIVAGRRRPAAATPAGVHVSPDGRYWWDGVTWRPTGRGP